MTRPSCVHPPPNEEVSQIAQKLVPDPVIGSGSSPPLLDAIAEWKYRHGEAPLGRCNQSLESFACIFFFPARFISFFPTRIPRSFRAPPFPSQLPRFPKSS
ncbi:hypothetical protein AVEN_202080-1 [Araneus ventricosus]|uniref:Uncharacterized protein n=1 Tax=Araneus ventricosus TaxID=182803 RepID=A0A4Y2KYB3_ARAVE|nr:hypothetical protein AVEN_202080-1 [Araneus ventricosus]